MPSPLRSTVLACAVAASSLGGCGSSAPTPTETVCPDPDPNTLTYDNFGTSFMDRYCIHCHASGLTRSMRNGAPLYHDFDTLRGVLQTPGHIDEQAGSGPAAENMFMPPDRCPSTPGGPLDTDCAQPTAEERRNLALWIACEVDRPHTF
ncbi:MAG: hypothetical protein H0X17_11595 [Deltaproteobacteria bacterium]|nr:hypothetical protein [Deltaproteobacteria bacterium]